MTILRSLNGKSVTALGAASTLAGTEVVAINQNGTDVQATIAQLASAIAAINAGGSSVATTYSMSLSASSVAVGSHVSVTLTPTSGAWPSGTMIVLNATGLTGPFSFKTLYPTGTDPALSGFTPNAAGSGTLSGSASGMTNPPALALTATDAAAISTRYTLATDGVYQGPPTSAAFGGAAYIQLGGELQVRDTVVSGGTPSSITACWTRSNTVVPTAGTGPNQYGANQSELDSSNLYGGTRWQNDSLRVYAKGSPTTGSYYMWLRCVDSSGSIDWCVWSTPCVMSA